MRIGGEVKRFCVEGSRQRSASLSNVDDAVADWREVWRDRLLFGLTGLSLLALVCSLLVVAAVINARGGPSPLATSVNPWVLFQPEYLAWLLSVTGLTSWIPLCALFCLRSYARLGWNLSIPIVGGLGLLASTVVTCHAWQLCSPLRSGIGGCW